MPEENNMGTRTEQLGDLKIQTEQLGGLEIPTEQLGELAHECILGRYVLIVGSESILDPVKHKDVNGDSMQWLIRKTGLKCKKQDELNNQLSELEDKIENCDSDEERTQLEQEKASVRQQQRDYKSTLHPISEYLVGRDVNTVKRDILKQMNGYQYSEEDLNPELLKLLWTRCFRVVITTAIDRHLECVMEKIWKDQLQVLNIYSSEKKDWVRKYIDNEFCDAPPTLYYAFGCIEDKNSDMDFVLSEDDAMLVINKWGKEKPCNFGHYLSNDSINRIRDNLKCILSIGCQLDNWQFRFFWYQLLGKHLIDKHIKARVAMTWNENSKLKYHIENFWNLIPEDDSNIFLKHLQQEIENRLFNCLETHPHDYVFISYANQNQSRAYNLALRLREKGISVWIDSKLGADGMSNNYNERIPRAIENCKVFMPLFTHETSLCLKEKQLMEGVKYRPYRKEENPNTPPIERMSDSDFKRFFFYEWYLCDCYIKEGCPIGVIPVVYSDYDDSEEVRKEILEDCISRSRFETNRFNTIDLLVNQIIGELNNQHQNQPQQ